VLDEILCQRSAKDMARRIGLSISTKPRSWKYERQMWMSLLRTRKAACWRDERSHRWRWSMRNSTPCSLGVMGYSGAICTSSTCSAPIS